MLLGINPLLIGGRGSIFTANAVVTGMGLYSTAAGTGGPLLYNGTATGHGGVTAFLLSVSYGLSVASAVAGAIGLTGGATTAPTSTTAATSKANLLLGGPAPLCSVFSVGTVSAAGTFFLPTGHIHTGAITVDTDDDNFVHLGGVITIPPGFFVAVAADAILTTSVIDVAITWIEFAERMTLGSSTQTAPKGNEWLVKLVNNQTAAGTTQGNAYAIPTGQDGTLFTTVGSGTGAILPGVGIGIGEEYVIANHGVNALLVYPPVGGKVGNASTNTGYSLGAGKTGYFMFVGQLQWTANP